MVNIIVRANNWSCKTLCKSYSKVNTQSIGSGIKPEAKEYVRLSQNYTNKTRRIMKDKTAKLISWTVILTIGILFWYAVIKRVMEVM